MNYTSSLYKSIFSGIHRFEVKVNISATAEGLVQSSTDYGMDVLTSLGSYGWNLDADKNQLK